MVSVQKWFYKLQLNLKFLFSKNEFITTKQISTSIKTQLNGE